MGSSGGYGFSLRFDELVNGTDTKGNGNCISMTLDAETGDIEGMTITLSRTYDPPTAIIGEQEAVQRARAVLEQNDPELLSQVRSVRLGFSVPLRGFGNTAFQAENASRRVFYVYVVRFDRCVVHISARTGKCHGGIRLRVP
jgi:hypothetical protein